MRRATVDNQRKVLAKLVRFAGDVAAECVTSDVLSAWRDHMHEAEKLKPTSTNRYLLTAGTFFNWLVSERELPEAPTVALLRVRDVDAPPVFNADVLRRLTKGASVVKRGRSQYEATRDVTMFALLQDTGLRASECAGLLVDNLNLPARQVLVHGEVAKGGYPRVVTFGFQTARLLNRYLREREAHAVRVPSASVPEPQGTGDVRARARRGTQGGTPRGSHWCALRTSSVTRGRTT